MHKILVQFDTDALPSVFDRVVAVDAGVERLFSYGGITPQNLEGLVHGAIFTRGPKDLHNTALFIGGSNVVAGEGLLEKVQKCFYGPLRVSVMMDSNGSNTTAAAAVLAAGKHVDLASARALVLGGTGPVGQRAAQLLAGAGAHVRLASRSLERGLQTADAICRVVTSARLETVAVTDATSLATACEGRDLILAAGAAGVELLPADSWKQVAELKVLVDLNAVPPLGIGDVQLTDKGIERDGVTCYGALGVGGTKMKIHKAAVAKLFTANNLVLDTAAIYEIGQALS